MLIASTVRKSSQADLRALVEDEHLAAAATPELQSVLRSFGKPIVETPTGLLATSKLPKGVIFPYVDINARKESDFETLKLVTRKVFLPVIKETWPSTKPYILGAQAIWAGIEFWDMISDEAADATELALKGTGIAQKATKLLLDLQGAPKVAKDLNGFAGLLLTTADNMYGIRPSPSSLIKALAESDPIRPIAP